MATPLRAQTITRQIDVFVPGPDGVLRLDLADRLDRTLSRAKPGNLERRKQRQAVRETWRKFAQDAPRPPEEVGRIEAPQTTAPRNEETRDGLRDEVQRLSLETARMRSETDALRASVARLIGETNGLRGEVGALREQLAKRLADPDTTGKLSELPRPSGPLRKQDSLKGGADDKSVDRPPVNTEGFRKPDERFSDLVARAWRRVREMIGRPGQ